MGKRFDRGKMVLALSEEDRKHLKNSRNKHKAKQMDHYLKQLFEKSFMELRVSIESAREDALRSIVEAFTNKLQHQFAETNLATILDRCLKSVKLGSANEIDLACHAIGLLVLTNQNESNARDAYEESLPVLSESLKSNSELVKIPHSSAIVTFVGAQNAIETETSMLVLWQYISESSDSKSTSETVKVVAVFASQALLLIIQKGCLAKFTTDSSDNVLNEVKTFSAEHANSPKKSSQMIQLNFFKHFLSSGLSIHMEENHCFHDKFNFKPKNVQLKDNDFCKPEITERLFKSPNSIYRKGMTQLPNKLRLQSQERNFGDGHAADD
ncbi:Interferon-related developmental regulator, N-terminal [Dillenia turbinata]|uniref:Interferon-related developmental regulator, N-terminal n=1 Tax=Dillenia turbinata TaxID=194707 RepID=A0AAN8URU2_9MAGN